MNLTIETATNATLLARELTLLAPGEISYRVLDVLVREARTRGTYRSVA